MAKIELSNRTVGTSYSPQPGRGADMSGPGRALAGLGNALSSFGAAAAAQQEKDNLFQFNADLQEFRNNQEMKFSTYKDTYQGNGHDFAPSVTRGYDADWNDFKERIPKSLVPRAEVYNQRFRGEFEQRGYKVGQQKRGEWYVATGTKLFTTTILPRVTGDVRSAESGLAASENIISSMDGIPPDVANNLRKQSANAIFKKWLGAAGIDAGPQAKAIVDRVKARLNDPSDPAPPGTEKSINDNPSVAGPLTVHADKVPSASERRAIFRKGGVVINLDTNWSKGGATQPMVVVPDGATAAQRQAAQDYANQIGRVYREQFGRDVTPRVVTRSQNGRGRAATIHTEPFAVTDPDAVAYFSSDAGLARHSQILRDTLGKIPGAQFSIPHDPSRGDLGAHGTGTDEVTLAKALLGKLTGNSGLPTQPYQVASNANVPPPGPVRAQSTREMFESLVIQNVDKIARNELRALQRSEQAAERKEREHRAKTRLEGYKLLFDRKLTREWVDANEHNLSENAFIELRKQVTPMGRITNPQTLSRLLASSDENPTETIEDANQAYAQGDLTHDDYRVIVGKARRTMEPDAKVPPWVKERRSSVKQQLRPKAGASKAEWEHYGAALKQYDDYVERMGEGVDRDKLAKFASGMVDETKARLVKTTRDSLEMPKYINAPRHAMTPEGIDEAISATIQARQTGKIDGATFAAEARKLKAWSDALAKEHEMFGAMQKQGAGKFSAPMAPGTQVKSEENNR